MNTDGATPDEQQRLKKLLSSKEPQGLGQYLKVVKEGEALVIGTSERLLRTEFQPTGSGLFIPAYLRVEVQPIDLFGMFITPSEIGLPIGSALTLSHIQRIPFAILANFVAQTMARLKAPKGDWKAIDEALTNEWLDGQSKERTLNLLRDPFRHLTAPQNLLILLKLGFLGCPEEMSADMVGGNLVVALLGVAENFNGGHDQRDEAELVLRKSPGKLGRMVIASQVFNSAMDEASTFARFARQWLEMPKELDADPMARDVEQIYFDVTGISLPDLAAVTLILLERAWNGEPHVPLSYFSTISWTTERLSAVLDLLSGEVPKMRQLVRSDTARRGLEWEFSALERFPVLRLADGSLLVTDSTLLIRRIFGWLPVFDVTSILDGQGASGRKLSQQFTSAVRHFSENYVKETLSSMVQDVAGSRIYEESDLIGAYGAEGVKTADCAIDYGDAWVVVEVTTSQLKRDSVAAVDDATVMDDFNKIAKKVDQIASTIDQIRADEARLTGHASVPNKRFYPLLVVAEGFPTNPVSLTLIRDIVRDAKILTEGEVENLEIVDAAELMIIEAVGHEFGYTVRDLMQMKRTAGLWRASMRDYILTELKLQPARHPRIQGLWRKVFEDAVERLKVKTSNPTDMTSEMT